MTTAPKYIHPQYVNEGEEVIIPWSTSEKPRQGLKCRVATACGVTCRVVNEGFHVDRWFKLEDLLVPISDPRA